VATACNYLILRCVSMIRNCVQIRALCTREQFFHHFSLLSVLKVRVVAGDSQIRMTNLILHEVTGHHAPCERTLPHGLCRWGAIRTGSRLKADCPATWDEGPVPSDQLQPLSASNPAIRF